MNRPHTFCYGSVSARTGCGRCDHCKHELSVLYMGGARLMPADRSGRDLIAGLALAGILANPQRCPGADAGAVLNVAAIAAQVADEHAEALLAELRKPRNVRPFGWYRPRQGEDADQEPEFRTSPPPDGHGWLPVPAYAPVEWSR